MNRILKLIRVGLYCVIFTIIYSVYFFIIPSPIHADAVCTGGFVYPPPSSPTVNVLTYYCSTPLSGTISECIQTTNPSGCGWPPLDYAAPMAPGPSDPNGGICYWYNSVYDTMLQITTYYYGCFALVSPPPSPSPTPTPIPAPFCGDKICNGGETCSTCSVDCGVCAPTPTPTPTLTPTATPTPTPTPTPKLAPGQPFVSLLATPNTIDPGDSVDLSWQSTNVSSCSGPDTYNPTNATSSDSSGVITSPLTQSTQFHITCTNDAGDMVSDSAIVWVRPQVIATCDTNKNLTISWLLDSSYPNTTSYPVTYSVGTTPSGTEIVPATSGNGTGKASVTISVPDYSTYYVAVSAESNYSNAVITSNTESVLCSKAYSISGNIFLDQTYSGIRCSGSPLVCQPALTGGEVYLYDKNFTIVSSTTPLSDGSYSFSNLPSGTYSVIYSPPAGYHFTTPSTGNFLNISVGL